METVQVGVVTNSEVKENRDSDEKSLLLQCEISQLDDVQTVELYKQAGEDYRPPDDSTVVILAAGKAWKIAIASDDGIESVVEKGERLLYSSDAGVKKAQAYFQKDGTLQINVGTDYAMAFEDAKAGFDAHLAEVTANLDALVATLTPIVPLFNAAPVGTPVLSLGPGAVPPYTKTPLNANLDASKVESVRVP
jgi:hypothetical protein